MNIILLSGGSGKRLWPLSNEVRSKQFIKLFKDENGQYESMIQRTYRQIITVDKDAKITIATSKAQVSAIHNQLGDDVSVCIEPARRDTFPAIALAAMYLKDVQNVGMDEIVIVCPVDPYVDDSYYESVKKLENIAKTGNANLSLIGIEPTYPSEKYGYIIPDSLDEVSIVNAFKEKPDKETAEKYLKMGALWNAGIFAFKLGYIVNKAHNEIEFTDYIDLFSRYDSLSKISFDYAVVEKEPSVQVMRYSGNWKDVGTWNMMSEVMTDKTKGIAVLDEECTNTNVINELDIPILVMGAHNMIIAASGDGILISDKERSGYMKPYAEKISVDVRYAEKSWGSYNVITVSPSSLIAKIILKAGNQMSYHSHEFRDEIWTVLEGKGKIIIDEHEHDTESGDIVKIPKGCKHTIIAMSEMVILETQIGKEINVKDKTKYELDRVFNTSMRQSYIQK